MRRVPVLLPYPFAAPLEYAAPIGLDPKPGDLVRVPLGSREVLGAVWEGPPAGTVAEDRLRPLLEIAKLPPLTPEMRRFIDWVAAYTLARPGEVLAMTLRGYRRPPSRAPAPSFPLPDPDHPGSILSAAQAEAAASLVEAAAGGFGVTLLDGVTGAGKTEVYLEAIAAALRRGRQALILLPEIALSAQWLKRFERRFGLAPALWHSDLTPRTRGVTWQAVAEGAARVVVGARSALFLPFAEIGLIVVDEEHESAFKQEEGVIYHARDMAVVRARLAGAPCVLVSATPSLETLVNAARGRYRHIRLPERHGGARLPAVAAIDLRSTPPERGNFLSPPLRDALTETFARGEQAMLFLNRRGYAPLTLCRACGHRLQCPNCSAWLVEHRANARRTHLLQCHHCGHTLVPPALCPACGAAGTLTPVGPGVERVTEEAASAFPDARLLVMASDTLTGPHAAAAAAAAIIGREVDLVIGTQIVAKGWHFPHLTLVGVVDADLGLAGGDLRAGERTFQLLHQVAGRAGRAEAPGCVLIQTFAPEHPVMQALVSGDLAAFMESEAAARRPGHWPPFGRLAALIVSARAAEAADAAAAALGRAAPSAAFVTVLGPAPAPLSLLRGRHRRRLLLKTARSIAPQKLIRAWLGRVKIPSEVEVRVDIDPVSFL
ncbi:MAG TPA: primosomal protein N' [Acetobacteraceae bacterium]|nr:primosomal protein N' [Acetobacteraceae bacterium]